MFPSRRAKDSVHSRASGNACSSVLGTDLAVVVPAQAGTHNHRGFDYRCPATLPCCGVWVPACAGTTAESHYFTYSEAGIQAGSRLRGDERPESMAPAEGRFHATSDASSACSDPGLAIACHERFWRAHCLRRAAEAATGRRAPVVATARCT